MREGDGDPVGQGRGVEDGQGVPGRHGVVHMGRESEVRPGRDRLVSQRDRIGRVDVDDDADLAVRAVANRWRVGIGDGAAGRVVDLDESRGAVDLGRAARKRSTG